MTDLLMPSDVKGKTSATGAAQPGPAIEPPSAKLLVRLFLIPFLIVAAAVGVMFLIGRLAGAAPSVDELLDRLRRPGGGRTVDLLVGPGSKQRYLDAKLLVDAMKAGMSDEQRMKVTRELITIIDHHTNESEGDIRSALLLALGRAWEGQKPRSPEGPQAVVSTLMRYADSPDLASRKAAIVAMGFLAQAEEIRDAIPMLAEKVRDKNEDLDVRLVAASVLGPIATPADSDVITALGAAMRDTDQRNAELVWSAALSLAQLGQREVEDTILKLLDREELARLAVYDRETDPRNPLFRELNEQEQERFLINTLQGVEKTDWEPVWERVANLAKHDPSSRVRYAAQEMINKRSAAPATQIERG